jgi:hypothetical protein
MPIPATIPNGLTVAGPISCQSIALPASTVSDVAVATPSPSSAGIQATKVLHLIQKNYGTVTTTAVTTATQPLHMVYGTSCTIQAVMVSVTTAPTGSDSVTVDVRKGNTATAFASILSSALSITAADTARTVYTGTLTTTTASQNDCFEVVVTASGTSCEGLLVTLVLTEAAF